MSLLLFLQLSLLTLLSLTSVTAFPVSNKALVTGVASFTYYDSYPPCCKDSPNYDPDAPTDECDDYSGCEYIGDMAGFVTPTNPDGYVSFEYVQSNNLVAFYDDSDRTGHNWYDTYALRTILLKKEYNGKMYIFNATIGDTCGNRDCSNCCERNSRPTGFLVDMEYYTVMNNFGTTDAVGGSISFEIY